MAELQEAPEDEVTPNLSSDVRTDPNEPNAEAAESAIRQIGTEFRRLRSVRGERIEDIAAYLDIKVTYLFAIEQGDLSIIPDKRQAKSVLRHYANYLGLDGDSIVAPMDPIIASLKGDKAPPGSRPQRSIDRVSVAILAASVMLGVLVGWTWIGDSDQFDLLTPRIAVSDQDVDDDRADVAAAELSTVDELPVEEQSAEVERQPAEVEEKSAEQPLTEEPAVAASETDALLDEIKTAVVEPGVDQTRSLAAGSEPAPAEEQVKEERPANVLAALVAKRGDGAHIYEADNTDARVIVRALTDVSVQVTSRARDYAWTRTMKPREMLLVPNRDDLELWSGDAAGVEILLDGTILPPLGPTGTVISGLSLAPASLEAIASANLDEDGAKPTF